MKIFLCFKIYFERAEWFWLNIDTFLSHLLTKTLIRMTYVRSSLHDLLLVSRLSEWHVNMKIDLKNVENLCDQNALNRKIIIEHWIMHSNSFILISLIYFSWTCEEVVRWKIALKSHEYRWICTQNTFNYLTSLSHFDFANFFSFSSFSSEINVIDIFYLDDVSIQHVIVA